VANLSVSIWERLLGRWCGVELSGEARLLIAVMASAIVEESKDARRAHRAPYVSGYFVGNFQSDCALLGLSPVFVLEQITRASDFDNPTDYNGFPIDRRWRKD
jgi:hypothetical protein